MAKVYPSRNRRGQQRETNWLLIGGLVTLGVVGLFALLFITLEGQGVPTPTPVPVASVAQFCAENENNCVEKGPADAPITVVEVPDYGCIHCRNFNVSGTAEALDQEYVETGQVRWIVMPFALRPATQPAAQAGLCAAEQDEFYPFHQEMFEIQDSEVALTREGFVQVAETVGLDVDDFEQCIDSNRYSAVVQRNIEVASGAGVSATPTFFINGRKVEGNLPLASFRQQLDQILGS